MEMSDALLSFLDGLAYGKTELARAELAAGDILIVVDDGVSPCQYLD